MVDISSQNNKLNVTVSSSGNTANTKVTPDYAQYYSEKSKEWAISNRIVDNIDYSSKHYANESKKQADISIAKATEVVESGNTAVSNIENARDNAITNVNTAGATQVALATEQATIATNKTSEVIASGNNALSNIDTAKNNAITSITNQETTSKTSLIDEGATQIGLIQNEGATQVANVQSTGFYMRDDKLYYINSQGEETEFKLDDIELNNPYSLFDSKYSDHELNNLSWLKSEGQWNAKAVYPTAYDKLLKVYNGTETVAGLSVKLSTETYTDYDFVLNTADETFRLPLLDGSEDLPSDRYDDLELLASDSTYNAPANGWFYLSSGSVTNTLLTKIGLYGSTVIGANGFPNQNTLQVKKGAVVTATYGTTASTGIRFIYAQGNGSLYYYVGETVQNANLIDAGRIGEQLANKADISTPSIQAPYLKDTYVNGTSWYRIWSDGYCEQGGRLYNANDVANTITLLKTMKDTNYSVFIAHGVKGCYNGTAYMKWGEEPFNFTATSFQVYTYPSDGLNTVQWKVCGYLASGQY